MESNPYTKRIENNERHNFDGDLNVYDSSVLNLAPGTPGPELLSKCPNLLKLATDHRMKYEEQNSFLFQYGPVVGPIDYRTTLAKFLTEEYNDFVHKSDIVLTTGASSGLHLVLSSLIDNSAVIFVDELAFHFTVLMISQFSHLKIVPIPLTQHGTNVDKLRQAIHQYKFSSKLNKFWGVYVTVPVFHNPTGITYSNEICKELIKIAREDDILIVTDDVYNLLGYNSVNPPKRLYAYDKMDDPDYRGNVISNGTFSKILGPGFRIGWMECPPRIVEAFNNIGVLKSSGGSNTYTSGIITSLIELGFAKDHLKFTKQRLGQRMKEITLLLNENMPKSCRFNKPNGGYFIWIELPQGVNADDFNRYLLEKYRVFVNVGPMFSFREGTFGNFIRISIAFHELHNLQTATIRLCEALHVYLKDNGLE